MQNCTNSLMAMLAAGRASIGLWCPLASAFTTEVVAGAGRYLAAGFTMVAVGRDLGLLGRGADAPIASFAR